MPHRPRPEESKQASKISDLLPIASGLKKPNAYQVFGLKSGEQDNAEVKSAIESVYEKLKSSKATAKPEIWNQAAKLAEAARLVLEDPQRRRQLDESLGVGESSSPIMPKSGSGKPRSDDPASDDPLADLLPTARPLSKSASGSPSAGSGGTSQASAVLGVPPGMKPQSAASVLGTASDTAAIVNTETQVDVNAVELGPIVQTENQGNTAIDWQPPKTKRRRRKNNSGLLLFGVFVTVMLGLIIYLLQFLTQGGRVTVTENGMPVGDGVVVAEPMPANDPVLPQGEPPNRDNVLPEAPSSGIAESLRRPDPNSNGSGIGDVNPLGSQNPFEENGNAMEPNSSSGGDTAMMNPATTPSKPPATTPSKPVTPDPPTTDSGPTPEMIQANQAKIEAVEQLIRSANWGEMKSAADALLKLPLNKQQADRAGSLFDIADLAMFYRGGIERGMATLNTGATFEIVKDLPVIVVEVSTEELSIQYNKRTKTFTLDELPPRLAEKLASFSLSPEQPDAIAGQALYRLIDPKTRQDYREDTFEVLASLDGQLEKVDTDMLQKVAKELFAE